MEEVKKDFDNESKSIDGTSIRSSKNSTASYAFPDIINAFDRGYATEREYNALMYFKNNDFRIGGRKIDAWTRAVLDILGIEKYTGTDRDTLNLIRDLPGAKQAYGD